VENKTLIKINIFLIEDHFEFRKSLTLLLNSNEQFTCKSYSKVEDAIIHIRTERPDIILMDINLPGMSGIKGTQLIKDYYPEIQIMMCTVYDDDSKIFEALKAGANGYLLKRASIDEIFRALIDLYEGGSPMSNSIARKVVASFHQEENNAANSTLLTSRENEILQLLAKGDRVKDIAEKLFVSFNTIRTHIRNIYEKLQVRSRTEAINKIRR
jgi:DNA-binding NarL/FixJ family response regulator